MIAKQYRLVQNEVPATKNRRRLKRVNHQKIDV